MTAKRVEDNVYEYTIIQVGQPLVIEDSRGRVIARERGVIRFRVLFDTDGEFLGFLRAWTSTARTPASTPAGTPLTSSG